MLLYERLKAALERKNYVFFDHGNFNLNLIAVRTDKMDSDGFDCMYYAAFRSNGKPCSLSFRCTTLPGVFYRENPVEAKGVAILKPGQYRSAYQIGLHQKRYKALVQRRPVTVYRDDNLDSIADTANMQLDTGFFGINHHYAHPSIETLKVGKWSAGCQVLAYPQDHSILMSFCEKAAQLYGNSFTYTLLEQADL